MEVYTAQSRTALYMGLVLIIKTKKITEQSLPLLTPKKGCLLGEAKPLGTYDQHLK